MERCGLQWRARSSFEKAHGEAPPPLQVIGFNVCAPKLAAEAREGLDSSHNETPLLSFEIKASPASLPKPASSPRSALQQLLLNQSLPSTSSPPPNHSLTHGSLLLSPSTSSSSSGLLSPVSSSPSTNHNFSSGLQQQQPGISPPAANRNGISKPLARNPSSGRLKCLLQSDNASSDVPANQISLFSSLGQSHCASSSSSSSSSSSGDQSMKNVSVSVNVPIIKEHNSKPSQAVPIKEKYEIFNVGKYAKTHEIKGPLISAKEVTNELPYVAKSKKSSWLHDDEQPSTDTCKKSSFKGVQQPSEHPFGNEKTRKSSRNEEKSKKSTLFMFMVSSPAPEFHHHHHGENDNSTDMDFLSSCHLCRGFLGQGEDVFMYSGDKAFCSMECRYQQIVIDERKERCPPPIIRSGASQVYQHTSITTTTTIMINNPHFIKTAAAA